MAAFAEACTVTFGLSVVTGLLVSLGMKDAWIAASA
jgi:hypothetical protein